MKLIYIKWRDACSSSGWFSEDNLKDWIDEEDYWNVEQVSWLYKETKDYIVLVGRKMEDGTYGQVQKIPKDWVIKKRIIKF